MTAKRPEVQLADGQGQERAKARRAPPRFAAHLARLVMLSVLPFVLLSVGLAASTAMRHRQHTIDEMAEVAETMQIAVERELQLAQTALLTLRTSPALDEALAAGAGGPVEGLATFHRQASEVAERHLPGALNIILVDPDGRFVINTLRPPGEPLEAPGGMTAPTLHQPSDRVLAPDEVIPYVLSSGQTYVSDLVIGPVSRRHIVGLKIPIERDGAVVGLLGVNLLPDQFGAALRVHLPASGYVASVVDRAGVILARTSEEADFVGTAATEAVQAFVRDLDVAAAERPSLTADGQDVYAAYRRLELVPWTIAYGAPRDVVDGPIRQLIIMMGGLGTLALGLFMAATLLIGRRLAGAMGTLAGDAEAIGRGQALPDRVDQVREVADVRGALRAGVASLAAAEERVRLAVDASGMATWDIDADRDEMVWAGHFLEMLDLPADSRPPLPVQAWRDRAHPEDLPNLLAQWQLAAREGGRFHAVYRIVRGDGEVRWLESYGSHISDHHQSRLIGVTVDVTERHLADEQRRLLMREVDHRAKNALAVVHSVVRLTRADDVASYAQAVEGRVRALARAHDLLARDRWVGAGLYELAGLELAAQIAGGQASLGGSMVRLLPEAVQPLSMVLHELATNAAKYGALSVPGGTVRLGWRLEPVGGPLRIVWSERDGPPVMPPKKHGFGTQLIEVTINGQLGGNVVFDWQPEGLVCSMEIPRDRVGAAAAEPERTTVPAAVAGDFERSGDFAGCRILVVEDEAVIGAALAVALSQAGYVPVGPFTTVERAMAALAEEPAVDAAVLDVNLANDTSLPIARVLEARRVPMVVVTGYSDLSGDWSDGTFAAVLHKPVDPEHVIAALGHGLRRARAAA